MSSNNDYCEIIRRLTIMQNRINTLETNLPKQVTDTCTPDKESEIIEELVKWLEEKREDLRGPNIAFTPYEHGQREAFSLVQSKIMMLKP